MSISKKALSLAEEITNTDEYKELKKAQISMNNDEDAKSLLDEYQSIQKRLQMAQANGQQPSAKQQKNVQNLQAKMQTNQKIKFYMEKQKQFNQVMQNVNKVISEHLQKEDFKKKEN